MKKIKFITKIILIFAFSTGALACGYSYYTHANPMDYFHPKPDPPKKNEIYLKIDSACHYYQYDPQNPHAIGSGELQGYFDAKCKNDGKYFGTWPVRDLTSEKFFNFNDLKPGDRGEDTISFHVNGDDFCGRIEFNNIKNFGNTCVEPETKTEDPDCREETPGTKERDGEMAQSLQYFAWLDQGHTPGFQGTNDPGEGDNVFNENDVKIFDWQSFNDCPKAIALKSQIQKVRDAQKKTCDQKSVDDDGDGNSKSKNKDCQGIPRDGHLMKGVTYFVGLAWKLPASVGNEVQTDGISFDVKFLATSKENCSSHDFSCGQCRDGCDECDSKKCPRH